MAGDPWFEVTLSESVRALTSQETTLESLRNRASALLAVAAVIASFLSAAALEDGWTTAATVAVASFVVMAVAVTWVLVPRSGWFFVVSARTLHQWDAPEMAPTEAIDSRRRYLAEELDRAHDLNGGRIKRLAGWVTFAAAMLAVQTVAWVAALVLN